MGGSWLVYYSSGYWKRLLCLLWGSGIQVDVDLEKQNCVFGGQPVEEFGIRNFIYFFYTSNVLLYPFRTFYPRTNLIYLSCCFSNVENVVFFHVLFFFAGTRAKDSWRLKNLMFFPQNRFTTSEWFFIRTLMFAR